ncbi:hypothetical protein B5V02_31055 [Mesorhizobium kowhaii]|uniref:NADPH-dependent FMN reductase-like domain-containing protein n=1 Tax=Mesorhizobium kowhaii TaxID=1300272 RepID=A0A2W7BVD8_9HYPH|nr:hypothetical protein B5V02_31055 [Mesorhizobium kowhaii]
MPDLETDCDRRVASDSVTKRNRSPRPFPFAGLYAPPVGVRLARFAPTPVSVASAKSSRAKDELTQRTGRFTVAVLVGSLRTGSYTRKIARALIGLAPVNLNCNIVEFADLPLYTEDSDGFPPEAWTRFRSEIRDADAVLIVTPEYNRSVPGGLKNAIDVGSRPPFESVWNGLPAAVVSASPSKVGGFGANHHIRQSLVFLNMPVMQQPEAYLPEVAAMFDDQDRLKSPEARDFLAKVMSSFTDWVMLVHGARSRAGA